MLNIVTHQEKTNAPLANHSSPKAYQLSLRKRKLYTEKQITRLHKDDKQVNQAANFFSRKLISFNTTLSQSYNRIQIGYTESS